MGANFTAMTGGRALIWGVAVVLLILLFSGLFGGYSQRALTTNDVRGVAVCIDEQMHHRSAIDEARSHPDWPIPDCS
jgi:hypothetical protein